MVKYVIIFYLLMACFAVSQLQGMSDTQEQLNKQLFEACRINADAVLAALQAGADVNAKHEDGETALIMAADFCKLEIVRLLKTYGAEINARDAFGQTALVSAARSGEEEVVKLLIELAADVNAQNNAGETAIMRAVFRGHIGNYKRIVFLLLKAGADIGIQDFENKTAHDWAQIPALKELLTDVQACDELVTDISLTATNQLNEHKDTLIAYCTRSEKYTNTLVKLVYKKDSITGSYNFSDAQLAALVPIALTVKGYPIIRALIAADYINLKTMLEQQNSRELLENVQVLYRLRYTEVPENLLCNFPLELLYYIVQALLFELYTEPVSV